MRQQESAHAQGMTMSSLSCGPCSGAGSQELKLESYTGSKCRCLGAWGYIMGWAKEGGVGDQESTCKLSDREFSKLLPGK